MKMFRILFFAGLIALVFGQGDWQSMVDNQLSSNFGLSQAAIIGLDGSVWGISKGFSLNDGDGKALASSHENPEDVVNEITLAGVKYSIYRADDQSIAGKSGVSRLTTVKTTHAIIIGVYGLESQHRSAVSAVDKLADYLRAHNY